jgi:hypothetical protein
LGSEEGSSELQEAGVGEVLLDMVAASPTPRIQVVIAKRGGCLVVGSCRKYQQVKIAFWGLVRLLVALRSCQVQALWFV